MTISEPMTLLTDYLLGALVLFFAVRLGTAGRRSSQMSVRLWSLAFYASAAAALAGGTYHGFLPYLEGPAALLLWKITVYAVGAAGFSLLVAAVIAAFAGRSRRCLLGLAGLKFLLYAAWMATHNDFRFVIYDYAPSLLAVLLLQIHGAFRRRQSSAPWLIGGILVSFIAAGVQRSGLLLHEHFNHNDLYHVIQMGAFWLLFRGGMLLRDRES